MPCSENAFKVELLFPYFYFLLSSKLKEVPISVSIVDRWYSLPILFDNWIVELMQIFGCLQLI